MLQASRRRPFRPGGQLPSPSQPPGPIPGTAPRELVLDAATNRVGEIMDTVSTSHGDRVYLRPRGGGREWTTTLDAISPVEAVA